MPQPPRFIGVVFPLHRRIRPRTYQAHIASQHVEKLRQFIKACQPDEPPHGRDPAITRVSLIALRISTLHHRPEFQNVEWLTVLSNSDLPIYGTALARKADK